MNQNCIHSVHFHLIFNYAGVHTEAWGDDKGGTGFLSKMKSVGGAGAGESKLRTHVFHVRLQISRGLVAILNSLNCSPTTSTKEV